MRPPTLDEGLVSCSAIKNHNLLLDFWIILKTVKVVLFGGGAH